MAWVLCPGVIALAPYWISGQAAKRNTPRSVLHHLTAQRPVFLSPANQVRAPLSEAVCTNQDVGFCGNRRSIDVWPRKNARGFGPCALAHIFRSCSYFYNWPVRIWPMDMNSSAALFGGRERRGGYFDAQEKSVRDFVTTGKHAQHSALKSKSTFFVLNRP
jgi:hypothetical protein